MYSWNNSTFELADMVGKTFVSVEHRNGGHQDELVFISDSGDSYVFTHHQECCEAVLIKDLVGDLGDLVGSPLLESAVECKSGPDDSKYGTETWTFYKFGTIKGHVNVSWFGESNGYYSESVDAVFLKAKQ